MDHGYGSGSFPDSLDCHKCVTDWRLNGTILTRRSTDELVTKLKTEQSRIAKQLRQIGERAVAHHFTPGEFRTKKAEWEEARRLGIYSGDLRTYYKVRKGAPTIRALHPEGNPAWIVANSLGENRSKARELHIRLDEIAGELAEAEDRVETRSYGALKST